jgi:fructan beta-fructosidase
VFTRESGKHQLWYGNFYAAQTYDNAPDGRRIQVGWAQGVTFPGMPFNQQMTIPVSLSLRKSGDDIRLHAEPVDYLETLEGERAGKEEVPLAKEPVTLLDGMEAGRVRLVIHAPATGSARLKLRGLDIKYDRAAATLTCGKVVVPLKASDEGLVSLECYLDRGSVEVFTRNGSVAISVAHIAPDKAPTLTAAGDGGTLDAEWRPMKSAWK